MRHRSALRFCRLAILSVAGQICPNQICPKRIRLPCQGLLLAYLPLRITQVDSEAEGLEVTIQPRAVNRAA
jgi:hypothetical protein